MSESPQNRKRDHPRPSLPETIRIEVKASTWDAEIAQSFSTDDASSNGFRSSRFLSSTFECGLRSNANDLRAAVEDVEVFEPRRQRSILGFSRSFGALDSRCRLPAGVTFWPPKDVDLAFLGIFVLLPLRRLVCSLLQPRWRPSGAASETAPLSAALGGRACLVISLQCDCNC